jgi:UDP-glucose 6-dehydrogenase
MLDGFSKESRLSVFGIDSGIDQTRAHITTHCGRVVNIYKQPDAMKDADLIFVSVNTPCLEAGMDLSQVYGVADTIGKLLGGSTRQRMVVLRSTVLPGTTRKFAAIVCERMGNENPNLFICYNPEFLEGRNSLRDFLNPTRMIIGSDRDSRATGIEQQEDPAGLLEEFWLKFLFTSPLASSNSRNSQITCNFYRTDTVTAEMVKLANNAALANLISFYNQMALICEKLNIDSDKVAELISMDPRIATKYGTKTRLAYDGKCLPKDLASLLEFGRGLDVDVRLLGAIREINEQIKSRFGIHRFG